MGTKNKANRNVGASTGLDVELFTGEVKWFNEGKGYGFLSRDDGKPDVFCHFSGVAGDGYKTLTQGLRVEFEVVQGQKGLQAEQVRVIA